MSLKLLRMAEVVERTGLSRSTLYRLIGAGEFPEPVQVGLQRIGFIEAEINDWLEKKIAMRDAGVGVEMRRERARRAVGGRRR